MKAMKTLFVGLMAMLSVSVAFASGNLKVNLASNNPEAAVVEITNSKMVNYEIGLFDQYGNKLYKMETKVPKSELKKRYDFSNLEDGVYWYTVKIDNEKVTKQLSIKNGAIEVIDVRKFVEPYIQHNAEHVDLSLLNYEKENVKLYVYDKNRTVLAETELGNDFSIHKRLDLSELRPGYYELVIANDYDVYQHSLRVD